MNGLDVAGLLRYVARRPGLVPIVLLAGWRLRANNWWRRPPFLPLPDQRYWNFRMVTATGSIQGRMSAKEIVDAAVWSSHQVRGH